MSDRIAARGAFSDTEIAEGLVEAVTVKAVASGREAATGDRLLWVSNRIQPRPSFASNHAPSRGVERAYPCSA
jgi:hypothetical protein